MRHSQKDKEVIARIKARKIARKFKTISQYGWGANARIYQKGIINALKENDIVSEFENEVLIQIGKL